MKKKLLLTIVPALVLVVSTAVFTGCGGTAAAGTGTQAYAGQQPEGFWVSGTGEVTVTPDLATVQLGVQSQEKNVADAQAEAADGMNKVMQALAASGIAAKDIQTGSFTIYQLTNYNNYDQTTTITGYQVTNMVTVKIRNVDNTGSIIDAAVQAGGDLIRINNIQFSVEDPSSYYQQAREKAIADAKDKAEQYAKLMGVKLGNPTYVSEGTLSSNAYDSYYPGYLSQAGPVNINRGGVAGNVTSISPGENKISLDVTVSYAIER